MFVDTLKTTQNNPEAFQSMIQKYFGATDNDAVYDAFDMLFTNMVYNATKEPNNTRIKTKYNLNLSNNKRLMQTLPVSADMSDDEKRAGITNVVNAMFGKAGEIVPTTQRGSTVLPVGEKQLGPEFVLDMDKQKLGIYGLNQVAIERVAMAYGIGTGDENNWMFPMVIKFQDGSVYMLQGAGDDTSNTIGQSVYDTLSGKRDGFNTVGTTARYTIVPGNLMSDNISPLGFDADEINKFAEMSVEEVQGEVSYDDFQNYIPEDFRASQILRGTAEKEQEEAADEVEEVDETEGAGMTGDLGMAARILAKKRGVTVSEPAAKPAEKKEEQASAEEAETTTLAIEPGRYVKFNDAIYIVTKINANGTIQIYNPTKEGTGSKVSVAERNLTAQPQTAQIVTYNDKQYMVTPKGNIISMATFKQMNWAENDGNRKAIMALIAKPVQTQQEQDMQPDVFEDMDGNIDIAIQKDLVDLNLTDKALRYLYQNSSQRMTFDKFAEEAKRYVDKTRGVKNTEDIIDDITCL
jgi:predicted transcriptional regulator